MMCYRDRSFCANQEECATTACERRLSDDDRVRACTLGIPVAWMPFKDGCEKFAAKPDTDDDATTR